MAEVRIPVAMKASEVNTAIELMNDIVRRAKPLSGEARIWLTMNLMTYFTPEIRYIAKTGMLAQQKNSGIGIVLPPGA